MRAAIVLVGLLMAEPASAACHRYSVWKYPYPQPKCGVQVATRTSIREERAELAPPPPARPLNFVAPVIQPPPEEWTEDAQRAFAIQKLREKMERK